MKRANQGVLVVFRGKVNVWWTRFLKPGFHHCFVMLRIDGQWVLFEPLGRQIEIWVGSSSVRSVEDDPQIFYRKLGYHVVCTDILETPKSMAPLGLCTCVEMVKRTLGIRDVFILTPFQLYCRLTMNVWYITVFKEFIFSCQNSLNSMILKGSRFKERLMGAIFSKPPKPDLSHIKRQEEEAKRKAAEEEAKNDARLRTIRAGSSGGGRRSLLGGDERGVSSGLKSTMG